MTVGKYRVVINHQGMRHVVGKYQLHSDAALAYDKAARILKGPNWKVNFASEQGYRSLREIELNATGIDVNLQETLLTIKSNVNAVASTVGVYAYNAPNMPNALLESLKGVSLQIHGTYRARILHDDKEHNLGTFELQTDAALAYDKAVRSLKGSEWETNFTTEQDYQTLRAFELNVVDLDMDMEDSSPEISSKVEEVVNMQ